MGTINVQYFASVDWSLWQLRTLLGPREGEKPGEGSAWRFVRQMIRYRACNYFFLQEKIKDGTRFRQIIISLPAISIRTRISVWNAWSIVSTRKMMVLTLWSDTAVVLVEPSLLVLVADTIPRTTAAINTARNRWRFRVMRSTGLVGTGLSVSCSLRKDISMLGFRTCRNGDLQV